MHSYYQGYVLTNIYWFASRIMQKYTQRGKETLWIHYQRTEAKLARLLWEGDQDYFFGNRKRFFITAVAQVAVPTPRGPQCRIHLSFPVRMN